LTIWSPWRKVLLSSVTRKRRRARKGRLRPPRSLMVSNVTLAISCRVLKRFIATPRAKPSPVRPSLSNRAITSDIERAERPRLKANVSARARPAIARPSTRPVARKVELPAHPGAPPSTNRLPSRARNGPIATAVAIKIQNRIRRRGRRPAWLHAIPKSSSRTTTAASPQPSRVNARITPQTVKPR